MAVKNGVVPSRRSRNRPRAPHTNMVTPAVRPKAVIWPTFPQASLSPFTIR